MSSILEGYNYDIFISYRQKDNKGDMWVSEFVEALKTELESTFKEEISVYFDFNPLDGLLETHDVDESLKEKLKCLVFIPIISRTYCDPKAFAWEHEFKSFIEEASNDKFGLKVKLASGNVACRVLPVLIYDLNPDDVTLCESVMGGVLRGVEFIYKAAGVNRPLRSKEENPQANFNHTIYRDQINKVANAIDEILVGLKNSAGIAAAGEKTGNFREDLITSAKDGDLIAGERTDQGSFNPLPIFSKKPERDLHILLKFKTSKLKKYFYSLLILVPLIAVVLNWKGLSKFIGAGDAGRDQANIYAINARKYFEEGQTNAAKREVALALEADPENSAAWTTLAAISIKEGDLNNAIKQTLEALSADPANRVAAYNLAFAFDDKHDYNQAVEWYSKAINIDSSFVEAYSALGHLYNTMDQPADAVLILKLAMNKYPGSEYLYLIQKNLGIAYYLEEIYDDAIKYLELSMVTNPDLPETNFYLASAYEKAGMMTKSIDAWQNYISVESDTAESSKAQAHLKEITVKHLEKLLQ